MDINTNDGKEMIIGTSDNNKVILDEENIKMLLSICENILRNPQHGILIMSSENMGEGMYTSFFCKQCIRAKVSNIMKESFTKDPTYKDKCDSE